MSGREWLDLQMTITAAKNGGCIVMGERERGGKEGGRTRVSVAKERERERNAKGEREPRKG